MSYSGKVLDKTVFHIYENEVDEYDVMEKTDYYFDIPIVKRYRLSSISERGLENRNWWWGYDKAQLDSCTFATRKEADDKLREELSSYLAKLEKNRDNLKNELRACMDKIHYYRGKVGKIKTRKSRKG